MQKEMQKIYENTPYAFEACRLSRILEPKKWFMPWIYFIYFLLPFCIRGILDFKHFSVLIGFLSSPSDISDGRYARNGSWSKALHPRDFGIDQIHRGIWYRIPKYLTFFPSFLFLCLINEITRVSSPAFRLKDLSFCFQFLQGTQHLFSYLLASISPHWYQPTPLRSHRLRVTIHGKPSCIR